MDDRGSRAHDRDMDDADRTDIQAAIGGDEAAYARLVDRHQNGVAKRMWRFTRDRQELEELVQDVFVQTWLSLKGFRGDAPFTHWLSRIATRVGYRFWKQRSRRQAEPLPLQDWDAIEAAKVDDLDARESAEQLHTLLAKLPPRDRLVLTLLYLDELSVAEAAAHAGWSKTMVKVQAFRARKKLRALLEESTLRER